MAWLRTLGGMLIWAIHFLGLYALASLGEVARLDPRAWRLVINGFSLACLLAAAVLAVALYRQSRSQAEGLRFGDQVGALAGGLAALAIGWQALPGLILD